MTLLPIALAAFSLFGSSGDFVSFDHERPGQPPANWTVVAARPGAPARWEIRPDPSAPSRPTVLAQVGTTPRDIEPSLAIFNNSVCRDGDLSVKFKIQDGPPGSRVAGLVWRYQDPGNYYLLRFSVDDGSVVLYRMSGGQLQMIAAGQGRHDLRTGQWYVAKVVYRGDRIRILFGNRLLFNAFDSAILKPGKTGLRTRAATTVYFDDFRIDRKG